MRIKDKVEELTNGNYHITNKKIEKLWLDRLVEVYLYKDKNGNDAYAIRTNSVIKRHNMKLTEYVAVSYTLTGKNKDKWRIRLNTVQIHSMHPQYLME